MVQTMILLVLALFSVFQVIKRDRPERRGWIGSMYLQI